MLERLREVLACVWLLLTLPFNALRLLYRVATGDVYARGSDSFVFDDTTQTRLCGRHWRDGEPLAQCRTCAQEAAAAAGQRVGRST